MHLPATICEYQRRSDWSVRIASPNAVANRNMILADPNLIDIR